MISLKEYVSLVNRLLGVNLDDPQNRYQLECLSHDLRPILQIVAGPGSGKTTVLVLRALRFVFVDDVLPETILITTFTRKAARELRSRWLNWGTQIYAALEPHHDLAHIDLNRCQIDTLDATIHSILTDSPEPGALAPEVTDATSNILLFKLTAFRELYRPNQSDVDDAIRPYLHQNQTHISQRQALGLVNRLQERLIEDRVDLKKYARAGSGQSVIAQMSTKFRDESRRTNVFSFAQLEEHFLQMLIDKKLDDWLQDIACLLVDEYQDTNPLQEAIYFEILARGSVSATIVGDDDQAMYRFRGGSVELFTDFESRVATSTGLESKRIDMTRNFRSRPEIVAFVNSHVSHDDEYQLARIQPRKRDIVPTRPSDSFPILGLFRPDELTLAKDLSELLGRLFTNRSLSFGASDVQLELGDSNDMGDVVYLSHTVKESDFNRFAKGNQQIFKTKFAGILRAQLAAQNISVFNPRGQALRVIPDVRRLLGLVLLSVDPRGELQNDMNSRHEFPREAIAYLDEWRQDARAFIRSNPVPNTRGGLNGYIARWNRASSGEVLSGFPSDFAVLELVFTLITWLPGFHREPEHQVWLEAVTRVMTGSSKASPYRMLLLQNTQSISNGRHVRLSRMSLIRDGLVPIAMNEIDVDEDIMSSVPRDYLQFMTIHQAKGLEFPFVIVDVGSGFRIDSPKQRFLRFPDEVSNVVRMEDDLEPHLSPSVTANQSGILRTKRGSLDRTFDDLVRLYYVAFSRPQSVLLLIGHERQLNYHTNTKNVALGWRRNETWSWRDGDPPDVQPVRVSTPFMLI